LILIQQQVKTVIWQQQAAVGAVRAAPFNKYLEILAQDMSMDEAIEFFDFNVLGAWVGDSTPIFIRTR
jgi:hypothetical protein